jgi:hypothetical protein
VPLSCKGRGFCPSCGGKPVRKTQHELAHGQRRDDALNEVRGDVGHALSVEAAVRAERHRHWKDEYVRLQDGYPQLFKELPGSYRELTDYLQLLRGPLESARVPRLDGSEPAQPLRSKSKP